MNFFQKTLLLALIFSSCSVTNQESSSYQKTNDQNKVVSRTESAREYMIKGKHANAVQEDLGSGDGGTCIDESLKNNSIRCPEVNEPVCGCDGNTYKNSCEAKKLGVKFHSKGPCNK